MIPPATKASYQEVLKGEYLINPINLNYDLKSLRTALSEINVCVSPAYIVLRATIDSEPRYLKYQLHLFDVSHMKTLGAGVRQTISFGDIGVCGTIVPPKEEQTAIASFLDRVVGEIDSTITSQERMIELLKERRSAIITQAVTKGLDPKAKMKDSGVPWLGQVPAHWEVKALKYVARYNQKTLGEDTNPDTEICYVEVSDVSQVAGIKSSEFMRFEDAPSRARRLMSSGEVIISTVRTYLKAIAFVGPEHDGKVCSTGFCVIRPTKIRPKFAQFALASDFFMASVISRSTGVSYPAINASDLVRVKLAIPPISEQQEIIAHLSDEVAKVDSAILAQERMIELLKERRSAIVTQAVTGQIDVR